LSGRNGVGTRQASMRSALAPLLAELVMADEQLVVLGADAQALASQVIAQAPDRYLEVGIAEANMMGVAAGLARVGYRPIVTGMAPFLIRRAYEQLRLDVANPGLDVTVVGVGGGLSYGVLGATHHAVEDCALVGAMPHTRVFSPVDVHDAAWSLRQAVSWQGPAYIRLGAREDPVVFEPDQRFAVDAGTVLRAGTDALVVATGGTVAGAMVACERLARLGVDAGLVVLTCLKPFPERFLRQAVASAPVVVTVEEHARTGGLGERVAGLLAGSWQGRFVLLAVDCRPAPVADRSQLFAYYGIDDVAVEHAVLGHLE
jgi:transketolase